MMIKNTAVVNENTVGNIESLQKEVSRLTQELLKERALRADGSGSKTKGGDSTKASSAAAASAAAAAAPPAKDDDLLRASLERFMELHKRNVRYEGQKNKANREKDQVEQALYAAGLQMKLLRSRRADNDDEAKNEPKDAAVLLLDDERARAVLAKVEAQLANFPQVAKWRVAVDEMQAELNRARGLDDPNFAAPSESDLGKTIMTHPKAQTSILKLSLPSTYSGDM